jgi:hypothetical protein
LCHFSRVSRALRSAPLNEALGEVYAALCEGRTRRDQLVLDLQRWRRRAALATLHLPIRVRTRLVHEGSLRSRYA